MKPTAEKEERQKRIVFMLTRHQVYLEALKDYYANTIKEYAMAIEDEIRYELSALDVLKLGDLTKAKFDKFLAKVNKKSDAEFNKWLARLEVSLKSYLKVEQYMFISIHEALDNPEAEYKQDEENLWLKEKKKNKALALLLLDFDEIMKIPMGSGQYPNDAIIQYVNIFKNNIGKAILYNYVNEENANALKKVISGTKEEGYKDGLINKGINQAKNTVGTVIQHVSSTAQENIEKNIYDKYVWVSVIDNVTSAICRQRNRMIFEYGKGPLPPAHNRCRSKIAPYLGDGRPSDFPTWKNWIAGQDEEFQVFTLGKKLAVKLREGSLEASDLPSFKNIRAISLESFKNKFESIKKGGLVL